MTMTPSLSWEEAITYLRRLPEQQQLLHDAYLDENPVTAALRYEKSEEFREILSLLKSYKHSGGKVLDVGAGNGIASYAFASHGYEVYALEPDSSIVVGAGAINRIVDEKAVSIHLLSGYGEDIDLPENSMDIVFARQVLHHASSLEKMCKEIFKVLKPGGYLLAVREHVLSNRQQLEDFLNSHPLHHLYGGENAYILKEYRRAFNNAGFQIVKELGPFETVINYAPLTKEQLNDLYLHKLGRFLSVPMVRLLLNSNNIRIKLDKMASRRSNTPGRLYSFIATKPGQKGY